MNKKQTQENAKRLVDNNIPLVETMARYFMDEGLSEAELMEAGMNALTATAEKYDNYFSSYVVWRIRENILLALAKRAREKKPQISDDTDESHAKERDDKVQKFYDSLRSGKISEETAKAINSLSLDQKRILFYTYGFGLQPIEDNEICEKVGLPLPQVNMVRNRLMTRLIKMVIDP